MPATPQPLNRTPEEQFAEDLRHWALISEPVPGAVAQPPSLALASAYESFRWYSKQSRKCRVRYQVSEVVLLIVSASVPVAGLLSPHDARVPAVLGAAVVLLAGLRAVFHWHDNWTRFTIACSSINAAKRLYVQKVSPYDEESTRDAKLLLALNDIEMKETTGWTTLGTPGSSSNSSSQSA